MLICCMFLVRFKPQELRWSYIDVYCRSVHSFLHVLIWCTTFLSHAVIVLKQFLLVSHLITVKALKLHAVHIVIFHCALPGLLCGLGRSRSKFVLTRLKHLEFLPHWCCVFHHVITIDFKSFNSFWIELALTFQFLQHFCLPVNSLVDFHSCRAHHIAAFFILLMQLLLALPVLISFGFSLPFTTHLINLLIKILKPWQV